MPPLWAEPLLRAVLPPDRRDDVTGDLLETFRETPRLSTRPIAAEMWYARQLAGRFLRTYWMFPALLTVVFITNDLSNTFRDVSGTRGPDVLGLALATLLLSAGIYGGWRTRLVRGGIAASVGTHAFTWMCMMLWWAVTTYPFALSQQQNPYWIHAWRSSSQPGETFMHWIVWDNVGAVLLGGSMLLLFALALGVVGGTAGSVLKGRRRPVRA